MKNILNLKSLFYAGLLLIAGCSETDYELGELTAPTNVMIETSLVGQDEAHPYGDGSGDVEISVTADNAIAYQIDFGTSANPDFKSFTNTISKKFTALGVNTYTLTVVAYGAGGNATTVTQDVTVESIFSPQPEIITSLVGDGSKTWVVDKSVPGHFGVGPFSDGSVWPEWWSAGVDEKVESANCFYTATFTFSETANGYSLTVDAPDGAFTKTGSLSNNLPGIPADGAEGCYDGYTGGSSAFSFVPSSTGVPESTPSTKTAIELVGSETFIGYGAVQKEYEILEISEDHLYLRVQGTEPGNAWYVRLIPAE